MGVNIFVTINLRKNIYIFQNQTVYLIFTAIMSSITNDTTFLKGFIVMN